MSNKKPIKLESPIKITKELFINGFEEKDILPKVKTKSRAQTVTFTLYNSDLDILEEQLDRATLLNKRNKNKSVIIRMALKALQNCSDEDYSVLYNKF